MAAITSIKWRHEPEVIDQEHGRIGGRGPTLTCNGRVIAKFYRHTVGRGRCKQAEKNCQLASAAPTLADAVRRFTANGVCTCHDGGPAFTCDHCEGLAALRAAGLL